MDKQFSLIYGNENVFYKIVNVLGQTKIKRRLLDMGFVNCDVLIIKKSQFKGVYLLQLRDYVLALKKKEVANIIVEVI